MIKHEVHNLSTKTGGSVQTKQSILAYCGIDITGF